MKKGHGIRTVLAVLLSFALSFLIVEVILRTTHVLGARVSWSVPDPLIGWRYKPDTEYWYDSKENPIPTTGRTNDHSWIDKDWAEAKAPGTYRVAILGDSYVEALQVEQASNFTNLAQARLNQAGGPFPRTWELMNFGRSGFTQTEELIVLQNEVFAFEPDLVAVFFYAANDIMDVHPDTTTDPLRPFPLLAADGELKLDTSFNQSLAFRTKSLLAPLKNNSAFLSLIAERLQFFLAMRAMRKSEGAALGTDDADARIRAAYLGLTTDSPSPEYSRNYGINKKLIRVMHELCDERGIDFLLVTVDLAGYVPAVEEKLQSLSPGLRTDFFSTDLGELAAIIGAEYLDLQGVFREHYLKNGVSLHFTPRNVWSTGHVPLNFGHEGHWNYAGHEVVAQALASKIVAIQRRTGLSGNR